jgi:hypothetical protein
MDKNHCEKCHQALAPGAVLCPNCGTPAPGVYFFEPSQPPVSPGPANSGRGARFWLGLAGIIGGSLCGCLALVMGILFFASGGINIPAHSQSNQPVAPPQTTQQPSEIPSTQMTSPTASPAAPPAPEATDIPTPSDTPADIPTDTPMPSETPSPNPVSSRATQYFDDFSNINGGWANIAEDSYSMEYFQGGKYAIALRVPEKMAIALPPYPFTKPIKNMIVSVKATGEGEDGFYGVLCHYQDQNNYYRVSFSGGQYAVDKMVNGQLTQLTSPFWKPILAYQPDANGYIAITLACVDGRIQLLVNDMGQESITDTDLDQGDALLFAASGTKSNSSGMYEQAFFDDFSAELQP